MQSPPVEDGTALNFAFGASITFVCNSGYEMSGSATVRCGARGMWSPLVPECRRRGDGGSGGGFPQRCIEPQAPSNGQIISRYPRNTYNYFSVGGSLTFGCDRGYEMSGPSTIRCNSYGWSDEPPVCRWSFSFFG